MIEMVLTILSTIFQMCFYIALGLIVKKTNLIDDSFVKSLSTVLLNVLLPCSIVCSMQLPYSNLQLQNGLLMIILGIGIVSISLLLGITLSRSRKISHEQKPEIIAAVGFMNFVFMGFPLIQSMYGAEGIFLASMSMISIRVFYYVGMQFLLEESDNQKKRRIFKSVLEVLITPAVLSVFVSIGLYIFGVSLPDLIKSPINAVGNMTTPIGMMLCGMAFSNVKWHQIFKTPHLGRVLLGRNILAPMFVMIALILLGIRGLPARVTALSAALPVPSLLTAYCNKRRCNDGTSAVMVLTSTALCIFTIPIVLVLSANL